MLSDQSLQDRPDFATQRLFLRRPRAADSAAIVRIVGDWAVASRLARVPYPYGLEDATFFIEKIVPNEWVWAIIPQGAAEMVGVVGLTPDPDTGAAELGYWLSPDHWGRGIATEAARAVVDFGFNTLALPYLTSGYFLSNPASGRVLAKLDFIETGRSNRSCLAAGTVVAAVDMQLMHPAALAAGD